MAECSSSQFSAHSNDRDVEIWKIKRLIKSLESARGNGTSMISLIVPPKYQIGRMSKMLIDEFAMACNIKSRVNRGSVLCAISTVQQRLKLYSQMPPNGLVIYCGLVITDQGKNKKVSVDFEPFIPINTSLYLCDNRFHTEALKPLLECDEKVGFVIIDGNGVLFGLLVGNVREVVYKFSVELPKKHGRGGQSALRFSRQRMEKRHNYIRKVTETAVDIFLSHDKPNVVSIIIAGSGEFKDSLYSSDLLDRRLRDKVIKLVDISYGAERGFNQAIEQAADVLQNVKFVQEKKLLNTFFEEVSQDTGKFCFGVQDTLDFLEQGVIKTLICWENLDIQRYVMKSPTTDQEIIMHVTTEQGADKDYLKDKANGVELDFVDRETLLDWLANNYKNYNVKLVIITDKSNEGNQFVHGFGGIGGFLRYKVDIQPAQLCEQEVNTEYDVSEY